MERKSTCSRKIKRSQHICCLFTSDQDTHLIEYLAKNNPGLIGRCGEKVYQRLVENVDGQWNWSTSHSWYSWRNQYMKNRFEFNQRIESYHRKHGLPMERVNSRRYTFFTPEDDAFLVEYLAKYNPEISGRTRKKTYQRLVNNVDDRWWTSRHSLSSWQHRYYNKKAEFDQRIMQYQVEHKKSTAKKKSDPIRKRPSRKRKQKSTSLADARSAPKTLSVRQKAARIHSNSPGLRVPFQTDPPTESDDIYPSKRKPTSKYTNAGIIRTRVQEMGVGPGQSKEARFAVVSSPPRHPSTISASRKVPATEAGRASVDVRPSTSPYPAQIPVEHLSNSLQASQSLSPLHWASPTPSVSHVEPAIEDSHQLPTCTESPLERGHVMFTPRLGNQHLLCPVFNSGPWKPPMLSQVESRVESSEDNDRPLPIYPPHTLGNHGSLWDMMKSGTPPLEKVVYSSPGDDVQNSSLHTARPPRRLRLFQPRPVSTDNSQRPQQDRGGPTVQQIPATHGFDAEVVRQVYDASRDHIKAERVLYRMRQAADAVRKAALD